MAAQLFDQMLLKGVRSGQIPGRTQEARNWFRNTASGVKKIDERSLFRTSGDRLQPKRFQFGSMYCFAYDPKHKETLPYYDRLPLIFPYGKAQGGAILGINMHYLPLQLRAKLMDALYDTANNSRYDDTTKLKINYQILNSMSKSNLVKPCVHSYLSGHVRSKLLYIHPTEWDMALFLPLQRFSGATAKEVWADSRRASK